MKTSVLVVDDNEEMFTLFEVELGKDKYDVYSALSGEEAIDKVSKKEFDIIFLDLIMPGMDGTQTCRAIREIHPGAKIALMTGKLDSSTLKNEVAFEKAGGNIFYLYKPFYEGEILEVLKKALSKDSR